MIKNIYGKRLKGYESIESENENESDLSSKIIKLFIYVVVILIVIILLYLFINRFKSNSNSNTSQFLTQQQPQQYQIQPQQNQIEHNKNYSMNDFIDIFPKTNSIDNNVITNVDELFRSRRLFINDKNITNDYIRFMRPINQMEEDKYNKVLYPNLLFNDYSNAPKDGQLNLNDFYDLCDREQLIESNKVQVSLEPAISIIISLLFQKAEIIKSLNSIQSQSFKNIEIIIVDDSLDNNMTAILQYILDNEPRARLFTHTKSMGLWRSRLDGYLYSRGKYIFHFDPGDIFSDSFVLEDIYNLAVKYNLDTVRFSFSKTRFHYYFSKTKKFKEMKIFPSKFTKIIYGRPDYDVHEYGYGTIWNRLFRANLFRKGLDLVDEYILNAYKNLWEDMWWNDLVDRVSFSNLVINRLGYIFLYDRNSPNEPKLGDSVQKDKTIREFIYFWFFDYQLLPKNDNKRKIIDTLRSYSNKDNTFCRLPMTLDFLTSNCPILDRLLILLYNDQYVYDNDKQFIKELYNKYLNINKNLRHR